METDTCPCGKEKGKQYDLCFTCNQNKKQGKPYGKYAKNNTTTKKDLNINLQKTIKVPIWLLLAVFILGAWIGAWIF